MMAGSSEIHPNDRHRSARLRRRARRDGEYRRGHPDSVLGCGHAVPHGGIEQVADSRTQHSTPNTAKPYGPFVQGLIGAVAMGSLLSGTGGTVAEAMPVAAGMGLLAAVFASAQWLHRVAGFFYSALGVIASFPTMARFVGADGCIGFPPTGFRYAALASLIVIGALAAFASAVFRGRLPAAAGLAFYGAVEILVTAASLLADGRYVGDWIAMSVMVLLAPVLGWLVVAAPDGVLAVAGVAFGMSAIYADSIGSSCGAANVSGAALIVMFVITYVLCRAVMGRFSGRG